MKERSKSCLSDAGLVYAALIWGSTFFIVKGALAGVNAVALVSWRFVIAALLLAPVLIYQRKPLFRNLHHGVILGIVTGALYIAQTVGLNYTTASNSGFITGLFIVFTPVIGYLFFSIRPSSKRLAAVAVSVTGLYLLTGVTGMNKGDLLTLVTAITYALHILFTGRFVKTSDPYALTFQQLAVVGIGGLAASLLLGIPLQATPIAWTSIIFLAVFPTTSAFLIQAIAQRHTSPVKVALIFALEPVFAAIFAWTVGGEVFLWKSAIGGLLIVIGMVIAELPDRNHFQLEGGERRATP